MLLVLEMLIIKLNTCLKKYFKFLPVYLLLTIFSCRDVKSIIDGGAFTDTGGNTIKTFYIYDYVNRNKLNDHLRKTSSSGESTTANYYFSHNSNIPSSSLKYAKSITDAKNIIKDYCHSIKYIGLKDSLGIFKLISCADAPMNKYCSCSEPSFQN
tara:strand:+ start:711 stop:1175 length:465 start_codon:yes stop_codon:yes gene_type:complete